MSDSTSEDDHDHDREREQERARPDPEDDPFACSLCGHYLGSVERVAGHDYCRACRREHGPEEYRDHDRRDGFR